MIPLYKKCAEVSGGSWLVACAISIGIASWQGNDDNVYFYICIAVVIATFLSTVCFYLYAKGYSAWWGIPATLLSLVGLYLVMRLPDRYEGLDR